MIYFLVNGCNYNSNRQVIKRSMKKKQYTKHVTFLEIKIIKIINQKFFKNISTIYLAIVYVSFFSKWLTRGYLEHHPYKITLYYSIPLFRFARNCFPCIVVNNDRTHFLKHFLKQNFSSQNNTNWQKVCVVDYPLN